MGHASPAELFRRGGCRASSGSGLKGYAPLDRDVNRRHRQRIEDGIQKDADDYAWLTAPASATAFPLVGLRRLRMVSAEAVRSTRYEGKSHPANLSSHLSLHPHQAEGPHSFVG